VSDERKGLLLTGDIDTMLRLVERAGTIRAVNLGGIHHRNGRVQRLRYLFLSLEEEAALKSLAGKGIAVTAQDVPAARPIPLKDVLDGEGNR
jgi:PTS system mannose-specific IIB component/fructoselysine and glucoselysine-specific PTS system IIB component